MFLMSLNLWGVDYYFFFRFRQMMVRFCDNLYPELRLSRAEHLARVTVKLICFYPVISSCLTCLLSRFWHEHFTRPISWNWWCNIGQASQHPRGTCGHALTCGIYIKFTHAEARSGGFSRFSGGYSAWNREYPPRPIRDRSATGVEGSAFCYKSARDILLYAV